MSGAMNFQVTARIFSSFLCIVFNILCCFPKETAFPKKHKALEWSVVLSCKLQGHHESSFSLNDAFLTS